MQVNRTMMTTLVLGTVAALALAAASCSDSSGATPTRVDPAAAAARDTGGPAGAKRVEHFTSNGDYGSVYGSGSLPDGGYIWINVDASRSDRQTVWLNYNLSFCDVSGMCGYEFGSGQLPGNVLKGDGSSHLSLRVDLTTAGPDFYRSATDTSAFAIGELDVDWQRVGTDYSTSNGVTKQVSSGFVWRSEGVSRYGTAEVHLTATGTPVTGWVGAGYMGSTHSSSTTWYLY